MSSPAINLPRGIRNCNPGNLREASGPDFKTVLVDGFAKFATLTDGAQSLLHLIDNYYRVLRLTTMQGFVSRYAPSTENDVSRYVTLMCQFTGRNPLKATTEDLGLNLPWRAVDFARAIIRVENGLAPVASPWFGEWVNPTEMYNALARTTRWVIA